MAFPAIQSVTETSSNTNQSSHSVNLPGTINSGDLLILFTMRRGVGAINTPSGFTELDEFSADSTVAIFAKIATGSETSPITVTVGGTPTLAAQVLRITGNEGTLSGLEINTIVNSVGTSPNPGSITASWGGEQNLFIAFTGAADDDGTVTAYPSGFSNGVDTISGGGTNNGATVAHATLNSTNATVDPGAFTLSQSEGWYAYTLVVRPSSSTSTVIFRRRREIVGIY